MRFSPRPRITISSGRWIAAIALAWSLATAPEVAARSVQFQRLSLEDGLSQADIHAIHQDSLGFMWFGTQDGLNRFDGYTFTVFRHDPTNPASLSAGIVHAIVEDRQRQLWVATLGGGLNRFDPVSETFTHFRHDPADPTTLSSDRVKVLFEDRDGFLWVGTENGLNKFDPAHGTVTRVADPQEAESGVGQAILAITQDADGMLWLGRDGGGLAILDPDSGELSRFTGTEDTPFLAERIRALTLDNSHRLWIGTLEGGLYSYDREAGTLVHMRHNPGQASSLRSNRVRSVIQGRDGTMWIGTDDGLSAWDAGTLEFTTYVNSLSDRTSLSENRVLSVYSDRSGILWVGTSGGGINKWSSRTHSFDIIRMDPAGPLSLSSNVVTSVATDRQGYLWVGTYKGGLNRIPPNRRGITTFKPEPGDRDTLNDERVMSLFVDSEQTLWLGTLEGGLSRYDRGREGFRAFEHDPEDPKSLSNPGVTTIRESHDGYLWIGTHGGGLNRLDRMSGRFMHFRHDPQDPTSLVSDLVTSVAEGTNNDIWVGTETSGLNRFDRRTRSFMRFVKDPDNPHSLGANEITALHVDGRGILWVGTRSGLGRLDPKSLAVGGRFQHYTEADGLPNNSIWAILEDGAANLWLSTNRGLARFDPETGVFSNFDIWHGLPSNEFNFGAAHRSATGEMFFGSNKGLTHFFPDRVRSNSYVPPVVLTSILRFDKPIQLDVPVNKLDSLQLSYKDSVVTFEFAALDYTAPRRNRYAYKLEGFNDDWIELGNERRATFTNLDPGTYTLRVRGTNSDARWSTHEVALELVVIPPPWRSWGAYTLYAIGLGLLVFAYTRAQANKLQREEDYSRRLEEQVQERTSELADANEQLRYANLRLEDASVTDSLTGLKNRRFLYTTIQQDIARVERHYARQGSNGNPPLDERAGLLFLIFDLDGFKQVNDLHGHIAGDQALLQVRDLLERASRDSDTLIRWGGDEFMIVGRDADRSEAEALAERIREAVAEHTFDVATRQRVKLTCSIGFAFHPFLPGQPSLLHWEQVLTIADRALYIAKRSGRDAWVGILGSQLASGAPVGDLIRSINLDPEPLVGDGRIELRTSIESSSLVWDRA